MDRIDIKIKNNKEFGDVAFLVDKPAFLDAIENLRKEWNIKHLLLSNKFKDWQQKLFDKGYKTQEEFEIDIRDLRIKLNKPETFDKVIAYAIVCGKIPDGVYKSTYWRVDPLVSPPSRLQSKTTRVAIYITPQSQHENVLKAFSEVKKRVFKARNDGYDPFFSLYNKDTAKNIKRDRDWYWHWLNKKDKDKGVYRDICTEWNNRCPNPELDTHEKQCKHCIFDINVIEQAVSRYRQFLQADI